VESSVTTGERARSHRVEATPREALDCTVCSVVAWQIPGPATWPTLCGACGVAVLGPSRHRHQVAAPVRPLGRLPTHLDPRRGASARGCAAAVAAVAAPAPVRACVSERSPTGWPTWCVPIASAFDGCDRAAMAR
jgi:hypothetical protein